MSEHRSPTRQQTLWVTRPAEDARGLAAALRAMGHLPVVEPLLTIVPLGGPPPDLAGVQALLATSANGVRAFAARSPERALPLLAVGDATARAARDAGFAKVETASGDVQALAALARRRLDPAAGAVLHIAASERAGDLAGALRASGFACRRAVLYQARPAEALSADLAAMIGDGRLDGVMVFSPRTGTTVVRLLRQAGLADAAAGLDLFCLSGAVADAAAPLRWQRVVIAEEPTQSSLLDVVGATGQAGETENDVTVHAPGADSLSSSAEFADTLPMQRHFSGIGGMNNDQKNEPQPEDGVPPASTAADAPSGAGPAADKASPKADVTAERTPAPTASGDTAPWSGSAAKPASASPASRASATPAAKAAEGPSAGPPPGGSEAVAAAGSKRGGGGLLWALLVLLLIGGAGAAAWFGYFQPRQQQAVQTPPPVDPLQGVKAAVSDLGSREARLREQLSALVPRLDAVENSVASLQKAVDELTARAEQGDTVRTAQLAERIARLETQAGNVTSLVQQVRSLELATQTARDAASKLSTSVLAVGQLTQAVDTGGSFVRELAAVRAIGADDPEMASTAASLEPFATSGVPSLAALRASFPDAAAAISRAEPVTAGDGWTDKIIDRVASLVSVRRIGPAAIGASGVDGTLAQAEAALADGDLAGTVGALQTLTGPPAAAAQPWLAQARTRLDAEQALAVMQQRAIARLSAAKG